MESLAQVVEVAHGERHASLQQADEFFGLLQTLKDGNSVGGESHGLHMLKSHLADAMVRKHLTDAGEADLLFEVSWVDHRAAKIHKKSK